MPTQKRFPKQILSKSSGLFVDAKRSRAAKKAAATRKANALLKTERSKSLRFHHKIVAAGMIAVVAAFTVIGIKTQLETYAASTSTGTFIGLGNKCLDNSGARLTANNKVQLYKCNGTTAQKWVVTAGGSLKANNGSTYCLDVPGNSKAEFTYVRLWKCNDSAAQHFTIKNGNLIANTTKFCATVHYAETTNGTKIWMKACHGSMAQKWTYSGSNPTNGGTVTTPPVATAPVSTPSPTPAPASGDKWGSAWTLGQTKPSASNTGTGIVRAKPTIVASSADGTISNGVLTITKSLKDRIVPYVIKVGANNLTIENNDITGDPSHPAASYTFINTNGHIGTLAQFNEIHASFTTEELNGIQAYNITARYNNVHHVVDGIKPTTQGNNNFVMEGNYVHDLMFFAPSKGHENTPTTSAMGNVTGPWANKPWSHDDGVQIVSGMTGIRIYGNTIVALWAKDGPGTFPLPNVNKELSCLMLNGGTNLDIGYNWFDGGEECVNNSVSSVTGKLYNNRFGRLTMHGASGSDSSYLSLYIAASGLSTTGNVFEDTGTAVPRHAN